MRYWTLTRRDEIPDELRSLILGVARQDDVHSVSCCLTDPQLWEGLLEEQQRRARLKGLPPRQAYYLAGPDSGIRDISKRHPALEDLPEEEWFTGETLEEQMGGEIHIPYEGACGSDLLVYPKWRTISPEYWEQPGAELDWATRGLRSNYLVIEQDLGTAGCVRRSGPYAESWWLYASTGPYKSCTPDTTR